MQYDREQVLLGRLNDFLVTTLGVPESDYAAGLGLASLLSLKSVLSDVNNLITLKLSLGLADWVSECFALDDAGKASLRRMILETKPNANGFDVWLGYPMAFVAEVKCNVPVNGGVKYGAQQRFGIIADVEALLVGKRKASMMTQGVLKFMAFLDLPEIRAANEHLLSTNLGLAQKLIFLEPKQVPSDLTYVHGVYVTLWSPEPQH